MSSQVKLIVIAALAIVVAAGLAACGGATEAPPPTIQPQEVVPATLVPTDEPTVAPTSAVQAVPLTPEEIQKLRDLAYQLPDGTTAIPASAPESGGPKLIVDQASVRRGDLNGDGTDDWLVILVNTANETGPQIILAPVFDEGGTLTSPGAIALSSDSDIRDISIGAGEVTATVWEKVDDGYQVRQATYKYENGTFTETDAGEPIPAPPAVPTEAPPPPAPEITMTLSSGQTTVRQQVDIYVHAFNSTSIVTIELHRDGQKVDEWKSSDPDGVPYVHHTFVWTPTSEGDYQFTAIAKDKWGGEGWSDPQDLDVVAATQ